MVRVLDLLDKKLLHLLSVNGRSSFTELGKKLGISESGVRKRIAKLKKKGIIQGFTIKIGKKGTIKAFLFVSATKTRDSKKIIEKIKQFPETIRIGEILGKMNLFIEGIFISNEELNSFVDSISEMQGVEKVKSFIVMEESNGIA